MKRQSAGHPVMGGLRLQEDGAYNGIIGCAGHWMLCPVGGAGDWFSWDPGGSGSDPKDFGVGCGFGYGREAGGARTSPTG